ncbi:MAG TPA: hypothetical protein VID29_09710 [Solirubrobacteraceae bacterium]|jgi:hypothetical protein
MTTEIRSYRSVFDLERRIYRIDRVRLNPGGIPVRGVVYFIAILATGTLLGALPALGPLVRALPWYVREIALPGAVAALLAIIRIEGRPSHVALWALLRFAAGPRHFAGARPAPAPGRRWRPEELLVLPDGSDSRLRRLRYSGPGAVLITVAHERSQRRGVRLNGRRGLIVRELPGRAPRSGQVIALSRRGRVWVR